MFEQVVAVWLRRRTMDSKYVNLASDHGTVNVQSIFLRHQSTIVILFVGNIWELSVLRLCFRRWSVKTPVVQ